ncbi:hypothetical protein U1Q18_049999, partial [Sarracenia purpurea var. burkii]
MYILQWHQVPNIARQRRGSEDTAITMVLVFEAPSSLLLRYNLERCAENKLAEKAAGMIEKKQRNLLKLWRFAWTKQYADECHRFRIERRRDVKKPEKFGRSLFSL